MDEVKIFTRIPFSKPATHAMYQWPTMVNMVAEFVESHEKALKESKKKIKEKKFLIAKEIADYLSQLLPDKLKVLGKEDWLVEAVLQNMILSSEGKIFFGEHSFVQITKEDLAKTGCGTCTELARAVNKAWGSAVTNSEVESSEKDGFARLYQISSGFNMAQFLFKVF